MKKKKVHSTVRAMRGALHNYDGLLFWVPKMTEGQLQVTLEEEMRGKRRASFVTKIHAAYSYKRTRRERANLLGKCGK